MSITPKPQRRKPDLFALLLVLVTLGMSVTVAYQINLYHLSASLPIAKQSPLPEGVGG